MDMINTFAKSILKRRYQEDAIDRLNYQYTVKMLMLFAGFVSLKEFFGEPIQCWVPAEFPKSWAQYANSYCYVESTYYVAMHKDLAAERAAPEGPPRISYYQWVPIVLTLQAFMFYLPHFIWRLFNWQTGVNIRGVISMACENNIGADATEKTVCIIAGHMKKATNLEQNMQKNSKMSLSCGKYSGYYVNSLYLFVKLLWVVNIVAQFFIMKDFLGVKSDFWGAQILSDLVQGKTWNTTGNFPRVTFCDFNIRALGNHQDRTVQCVLAINLFTEKIYVFVWWWFLLVAIVTVLNYLWWLYLSVVPSVRGKLLEKLLILNNRNFFQIPLNRDLFPKFVDTFKPDGVFVIRMMNKNAGDLITSKVLSNLYGQFKKENSPSTPKVNPSGKDTAPKNPKISTTSAPLGMHASYGEGLNRLYPSPTAPIDSV